MQTVKIRGREIPCEITGKNMDEAFGYRHTNTIICNLPFADADALFQNDTQWSCTTVVDYTENGEPVMRDIDKSEFCVVCSVAKNMDGTVSITMGQKTDGEMLQELKEMINRGV